MVSYVEALLGVLHAARALRAYTGHAEPSLEVLGRLYAALDRVADVEAAQRRGPPPGTTRFCANPECWRIVDIADVFCYQHSEYACRSRRRYLAREESC